MDYFFTFKKMLAPVLIRIIYWIGLVLIVICGIASLFGVNMMQSVGPYGDMGQYGQYGGGGVVKVIAVLIGIPIAIILWRLWTEMWLVIFQINDRLGEIKDSLKSE